MARRTLFQVIAEQEVEKRDLEDNVEELVRLVQKRDREIKKLKERLIALEGE